MEIRRKRTENWSDTEVTCLINGYVDFQDILDGKISQWLSHADKNYAWEDLLTRVNSQSIVKRTMDQIKKKVSDLKSLTKKKERDRQWKKDLTGPWPPPAPLKPWEEKLLEALRDVACDRYTGIEKENVGLCTEGDMINKQPDEDQYILTPQAGGSENAPGEDETVKQEAENPDCEMCQPEDPENHRTNHIECVRLSLKNMQKRKADSCETLMHYKHKKLDLQTQIFTELKMQTSLLKGILDQQRDMNAKLQKLLETEIS